MAETLQTEQITVPKKKKPTKKLIKWAIIALVILLVAGIAASKLLGGRKAAPTVTYQEATAEMRDITNALTGSGTLQPADSYTVTTLVSGEILSDHFEEGEIVKEDQLLYTIDSSDASSSQTQAQNSYKQALKGKYPTADLSGYISEVYVQDGDSVSNGTKLCKIRGSNTISADFMFAYAEQGAFYVGQSARVFFDGLEGEVAGTVQQVGQSGVLNESGAYMTTVRVSFENPGLVAEGDRANAVIGNYTSYGMTSLRVGTSSVIAASASGKVSGMKYLPGDAIGSGDRICTITGDSVDQQLENALTNLENAQERLDNYQVTSPISGTVIEKYSKAGDNVGSGSGNSNTSLCIIYDLRYLEMILSIDELDISKVAVGQPVQVTADAVPGQIYEGVVTKVSVVGTTSSGTTTYPVTIRIDETAGLLPGMNVDAEITLSNARGVLAIPNGALNRGNTVMITADSPSAVNALEQEAPAGYVYVQVEVGISDDSHIQVLSGLQEGDTVAYLRTSSSNMMGMMMGGMPGGMRPGGMPSGGMPGGGMSGGMRPSGGMGGGMPAGGPRG